jgi:SHS2 domain-containing protein
MVTSFADTQGNAPRAAVPFELEARDDEDALVRLLEEVIYIIEVKRLLAVDIRLDRDPSARLRGVFQVVPLEKARIVGAAPKAVSWGGLRIAAETSGLWRARVTLDV